MWYTAAMGTRAQCGCGWQLELSEHYAGKRIRCPECARVVDIPGESTVPLYNSPLPDHAQPAPGPGRWVPLRWSCGAAGQRQCGGAGVVILLVVALMTAAGLLGQCRNGQPEENQMQQVKPSEKSAPKAADSPEQEEDF
jgi:hypothetical protein